MAESRPGWPPASPPPGTVQPGEAAPFSRAAGLPPAVTALVHAWKDELLAAYLDEADARGVAPLRLLPGPYAARLGGDDMAFLEAYLRLDDDIVQALSDSHARRIRDVVARLGGALGSMLTGDDKAAFEAEGVRAVLAVRDYPVVAEFLGRINDLQVSAPNQGDYSDLFCEKPFLTAEIAQGGRTFLCCPLQLPTTVGDAGDGSFMDVWNSPTAQAIRASILDGSFSYCRERTCGALRGRKLPRRAEVTDPYLRAIIQGRVTRMPRGPVGLTMNYDRSCNLACPTCRTDLITLKGGAKAAALAIQDWATRAGHLSQVGVLHFTGSGDAFASSVFQGFLRRLDPADYPNLRIGLGTNGLLFTPKAWERLGGAPVDVACVSVDAASPRTYAENRGGDFGLLLENLRFIGRLRAEGKLKLFTMNFVVQDNNFAEMPAFAELGRGVGVDFVFFQQLVNWGTFSREAFRSRAVHLAGHPRHGDFLEVLRDPRLASPVVDLNNLAALRDDPRGTGQGAWQP